MSGENKSWWRGILAAWHYGRGLAAYKSGKFPEAIKKFRRSDELEPSLETKAMIAKAERGGTSAKRKTP